jgi:hypothetical protein
MFVDNDGAIARAQRIKVHARAALKTGACEWAGHNSAPNSASVPFNDTFIPRLSVLLSVCELYLHPALLAVTWTSISSHQTLVTLPLVSIVREAKVDPEAVDQAVGIIDSSKRWVVFRYVLPMEFI